MNAAQVLVTDYCRQAALGLAIAAWQRREAMGARNHSKNYSLCITQLV